MLASSAGRLVLDTPLINLQSTELHGIAERYCVVYQTIRGGVSVGVA